MPIWIFAAQSQCVSHMAEKYTASLSQGRNKFSYRATETQEVYIITVDKRYSQLFIDTRRV